MATSLAGVEALVVVGYAALLLASIHASRLPMGLTNAAFFALYGVALGVFALALARLRSWARAPVVLAQLIQLGLAWGLWGGGSHVAAVVVAVVGVLVLAGIFHPGSLSALERRE